MSKRQNLLKNIPTHPKKDTFYWADYIEVLCLLNSDGIMSQTDFIERISKRRELEGVDEAGEKKKNIKVNESNSQWAEDSFSLLDSRVNTFKEYYPFEISENKRSLHLKETITEDHKIYLFLLFCSCLGVFSKHKTKLTSSFELLSLETLGGILPSNGNAKIFGSSNIEELEDETEKTSLFWNKLHQLTNEIKEDVVIKKSKLSKYNKGDGGLDVYGWIDLGDKNTNFPLFFCQCACTPEWPKKQNSSKFDRWNNFISLSTYPMNLIFIPFSFRDSTGDWHEPQIIEKSTLFDRQRLIYCFKPRQKNFSTYSSYDIINNIIQEKESII